MTDFKIKMAELAAKYNISHKRDIDWHNFVYEVEQLSHPELAESEDERIMEEIIQFLRDASNSKTRVISSETLAKWADFLEKQKEQKPVTKDGQQECPYKDLALVKDFFGKYKRKCKLSNKACDSKECKQWNELQAEFKRINEAFENGKNEVINRPEVFGLQKPAEWSEEDKTHLCWIIECFYSWKYQVPEFADQYQSAIDWLKSLRPDSYKNCNSRWKPSEEQMEALMLAIEGKWDAIKPTGYMSRRLEDLYEGLANTFGVECNLEK